MERESFENEEIARVLNENFIPIKIDRYCPVGSTRRVDESLIFYKQGRETGH